MTKNIPISKHDAHDVIMAIASRLRKARLDLEMLVEELAARVGVTPHAISLLEEKGDATVRTLGIVIMDLGLGDAFVAAFVPP